MPAAGKAALLSLLNTACMNDGNLGLLPLLNVLPVCVSLLASALSASSSSNGSSSSSSGSSSQASAADKDGVAVARCSLHLLCTAATSDDVRKVISKHLGTEAGLVGIFTLINTAEDTIQARVGGDDGG